MYSVINTDDTTTNGFYVIQFISEAYTLQNNTQIDWQVISDGELVAKTKYPCSMQENYNWYWKQQSLQQTIIVPTCTILHPSLYVVIIRYFQDIAKNVCDRIQEKIHTKTYYLYDRCWLLIYYGWNWAPGRKYFGRNVGVNRND